MPDFQFSPVTVKFNRKCGMPQVDNGSGIGKETAVKSVDNKN